MKEVRILLEDGVDLSPIIAAAAPHMKALNVQDLVEKPIKRAPVTRNFVKGKSIQSAIMDHYIPTGEFGAITAADWLAAVGFKRRSASSAISSLLKSGHIVKLTKGRSADHRYRFIKKLEK